MCVPVITAIMSYIFVIFIFFFSFVAHPDGKIDDYDIHWKNISFLKLIWKN